MSLSYPMLKPFLFAAFFSLSMGFFGWSCWRLARLVRLGQDRGGLFSDPVDRIGQVIYLVFFQRRVLRERFGWNHAIFFWSFLIITVGHTEFIVRGIIPSFSLGFLGDTVYSAILIGGDVMAFLVLFAVVFAVFRRVVVRPKHIAYQSVDAFRILGLITSVMVTYFLAMAFGLVGQHSDVALHGHALPVSSMVAGWFADVAPEAAGGLWYETFWWGHAVVLMAFLNYIPHSKHLHLLGAIPNIYVSEREKPKSALSRLDFEHAEVFGVGKVTDFSWKALLDTYACTECGRCDLYCPANNTGKPLKPQEVIHDVKDNLYINGDRLLAERGIFEFSRAPDDFEATLPLIAASEETRKPGQTSADVLWACTTCGACVEACPVLIDHVDTIMDMRRHLALMEGEVSPELATTYKNIENNYNPWGIGADKRAAWAEASGLKYWGGSEDAESFEYLFWVGCAGSFDNRAQKVVRAFAEILDQAGIRYAILGQKEKCTGDPVRRTGNEYMFDELAQENVATLNELGVQKIVTACPHCLNTLRREYPAFGGDYDVIHHSQLIADLLEGERITLKETEAKKLTFHDPCYLGRWNQEYEAPRQSLAAVRQLQVVEMDHNRERSFCCGAGGGQMWMEDHTGTRVNYERTRQALETDAEVIGVACPFCMTMLEDGIKNENREDDVEVLDVAEIVAGAMVRSPKAESLPSDAPRKTPQS